MNSPIHNRHPACLARRRKSRDEKFEVRLKMIERAEMQHKNRPLERTVIDGGCVLYRPSRWPKEFPFMRKGPDKTTPHSLERPERRRD
jgi:hypothetical protein